MRIALTIGVITLKVLIAIVVFSFVSAFAIMALSIKAVSAR